MEKVLKWATVFTILCPTNSMQSWVIQYIIEEIDKTDFSAWKQLQCELKHLIFLSFIFLR